MRNTKVLALAFLLIAIVIFSSQAHAATEYKVWIKSNCGGYMNSNDQGDAGTGAPHKKEWERWIIIDENGGKLVHGDHVFIKSEHHKKYLNSNPDGAVGAGAPHKKEWERWVIENESGREFPTTLGIAVFFRSVHHGSYLKADPECRYLFRQGGKDEREARFVLEDRSGGGFLKSISGTVK